MNPTTRRQTKFIDLGLMDYKEAWDYQTGLFNEIVETKIRNRTVPDADKQPTPNYLIVCEHPHVFTLGRSGDESNLLIRKDDLSSVDASYYHINRGGDITYHGPGQIVVYPVLDLENFFTDIHRYMRFLEEAVIQTLYEYGVASGRLPGLTGVWIDGENPAKARKICALGVKTSRWVTLHGLAFNVNTNLGYFDHIIPCGIGDKMVTSMAKELSATQDITAVRNVLIKKITGIFDMSLLN